MSKSIGSFFEDKQIRFRAVTVLLGVPVITEIPLFTAMFIERAFFR